jgi:hypothetical protein
MNMRKGMIVVACLAFALSGHGQMEKGRLTIEPHVGMTVANFVGSGSMGATGQIGFTGGAEFQYGISERLSLSAGINYAQYGARDHGDYGMAVSTSSYSVAIAESNQLNYHVDYLTLPLTIAFHPYQGLFLRTGVQMGVRVRTKAKGKMRQASTLFPKEENVVSMKDFLLTYLTETYIDTDFDEQIRTIDLGIPIGIGYEYKNLTLDARYFFGLLNVSKVDGEHVRNSAFMFTLGYKIPFSKR